VVLRGLREAPPPSASGDDVLVEVAATDADGNLEATVGGEIVLSVPSPEALRRQADDVHAAVDRAGTGVEPLVIVVESGEELREPELAPVVTAARRARRPVILRIVHPAERPEP